VIKPSSSPDFKPHRSGAVFLSEEDWWGEVARSQAIEDALWEGLREGRRRPRRRRRKVTLARAIRQAKQAGLDIAGATLAADGTVSLAFGEPAKTSGNELDQWIAKHARPAERH
jgi:hypothetical protein